MHVRCVINNNHRTKMWAFAEIPLDSELVKVSIITFVLLNGLGVQALMNGNHFSTQGESG